MGSRRQLLVACALALSLIVVRTGGEAHAQSITGTVTHRESGEALSGVLVSVLDLQGERIRGVLTDASGAFIVEVPLGRYRLLAERIGLRAETTDPFDLNTFNAVVQHMVMSDRAIEIAGLVVDSRVQSCRLDRQEASRIQRWWVEIRTALDASATLQGEAFGRFLVEGFEREWDRDLRELIASNRRVTVSESTRPFFSPPAEVLSEEGFVQGGVGPERFYYGPDADVLLSNRFLAEHCFSLVVERDDGHRLGLRFEPVEGREVVDIGGTLWVDTTTAELTELEFRYENLDGPESDHAGGRIAFDYLPSGAWIVSDWYIRMPILGLRGRSSRPRTLGYRDGGGSVIPLDPPPRGGAVGMIRGTVVDSLRGGGLANALVTILGTSRQALTGADGSFVFVEVPEGEHYVGFAHDEVDTWGLGTGYARVTVQENASAEVELAVPGFENTALSLCLGAGVDAETVVVGHFLGPGRLPRANLPIRLEYERRGRRGPSMVELDLRTDEAGRFVTCSIPPDAWVVLQILVEDRWVQVADFVPGARELTYREVWFRR